MQNWRKWLLERIDIMASQNEEGLTRGEQETGLKFV